MENLIIIRTLSQLNDLKACINDNEYIAFDTETNGVDKDSLIIGFSIATSVDNGHYVILSEWNVETSTLVDLETKSQAKEIMQMLVGKKLIMQNAPFDCSMVENNFGVALMASVHTDTMILGHILDENRHNGLKELGVSIFGEDARAEQIAMKESVHKNGGMLTKEKYELYKADSELLARYGAKDAILTIKLFYHLVPLLYEEGLDSFFYDDESMPLLKGPTYELNTTGLKVDAQKLKDLKATLEAECLEAKAFIYREITPWILEKYPANTPSTTFNIGSSKQLSWLLFVKLGNTFNTLTKEGRNLCKALGMKLPYTNRAKREFLTLCLEVKNEIYQQASINPKTKKLGRPKKVGDVWNYIACDKTTLKLYAKKYKWVERYLEYAKNLKLLTTYVEGIEERIRYGIIRPSFLQHGTTSGRYSSKAPNFQNLPRDDKRVKACIVSRPGKVFVGADYSQLEPRVFASFSNDKRLLDCFKSGDDFYSVIGAEVFDKFGYSFKKDDNNSFAKKFPELRNIAKVVALSSTYGTTAPKMAPAIGKTIEECQEIIDNYFERFPSVKNLMLDSHAFAKKEGRVVNLFGRPRRMPKALLINTVYGKTQHSDLPYEIRNILNLAINHRIQSTGASIMNRAAIAFNNMCKEIAITDHRWLEVKLVLQVHDELIVESPEVLAEDVVLVLKDAMENTVKLPGVDLVAEPKIAYNLADLK